MLSNPHIADFEKKFIQSNDRIKTIHKFLVANEFYRLVEWLDILYTPKVKLDKSFASKSRVRVVHVQ